MEPAEVKRLYLEEELSLRRVARHLDVSIHRVRACLDREGVQLRPPNGQALVWTPEILDEARRLYVERGYSLARVAHRLHTSVEVLRKQLTAAGVQIRKRWPSEPPSAEQ